MLGRKVAKRLESEPPESLVAPELVALAREADLFVLNLECCISERGEPLPGRVFHFRAPPVAVETLAHLGVNCVTLANNHALDFGPEALVDTLLHLQAGGIASVGAGADHEAARAPVVLETKGFRLAIVAVTDHPQEYAAGTDRAGVAFADLGGGGLPRSLTQAIVGLDADAVLVTPHWGPNLTAEPVEHVRAAAGALLEAGATLVAGHSAHVFQGVAPRVLYDLGDFLDDYRVDPRAPIRRRLRGAGRRGGCRGRPPRHDLALDIVPCSRRLASPSREGPCVSAVGVPYRVGVARVAAKEGRAALAAEPLLATVLRLPHPQLVLAGHDPERAGRGVGAR